MKIFLLFFLIYKAVWLEIEDTFQSACLIKRADSSFLQLYQDQQKLSIADWQSLFKRAHKLGINHIIIQWSTYNDLAFYPLNNYQSNDVLAKIIRAAKQEHLTLAIGLNYDQTFWQALNSTDQELKNYLDKHYQMQQTSLPSLVDFIASVDSTGDTVTSWYITDELDDLNWQTANRRNLLKAYLDNLIRLLKQQKPNWPIAISIFASGQVNQTQIESFYHFLFHDTAVDKFLLQDSIGTKKLTLTELKDYLAIVAKTLQASQRQFAVIIELFIEDSKQNVFVSAPPDLVTAQLSLATKYSTTNPILFSFFSYVLPSEKLDNQALYTFWQAKTKDCSSLLTFIIDYLSHPAPIKIISL
ncbi:DUF4434 domain-containing protein [Legionella sp. D16C41]|uniref:DUF4434 domain-containing protein n=1 Tax=Legionella sp. D16C41 TaxID=3402688 RepID=UPI003AF53665